MRPSRSPARAAVAALPPRGRRSGSARAVPAGRLVAAPLLLGLVGCAGLAGAPATAPDGLALRDRDLRGLLSAGRYEVAYERVADGHARLGDELLRFQYEGLLAHYARRWGRSNASLQAAADLAEKRYTRSLTKSALSLLTNDRILAYRPPAVERLLIHYYGALNYLGMGDTEGAGVEARRLSHLLDLYADRGELDGPGGRRLHAALRYVAGAAFEAIGEENDAAVAYRLARRLDSETRLPVVRGPPEEGPASRGEVLVIVERGFAAHRVERSTTLLMWPDEIEALRAASRRDSFPEDDPAAVLALRLASRALTGRTEATRRTSPAPWPTPSPASWPTPSRAEGDLAPAAQEAREGPRLPRALRIAWSVYGRSDAGRFGGGAIRLLAGASLAAGAPEPAGAGDPIVAGATGGPSPADPARLGPSRSSAVGAPVEGVDIAWVGDVSKALIEEGRRQEPATVARAIVRAAAKLAIARGIEEGLEEEDEMLGEVAGTVLSIAGALTERADTRCWSLLPAEIGLMRLRLPAGPRRLELEVRGLRGSERLDLGDVHVRPGRLVVVDARDRV